MVLYQQFSVASWLRCLLHCLLHVYFFSLPLATRDSMKVFRTYSPTLCRRRHPSWHARKFRAQRLLPRHRETLPRSFPSPPPPARVAGAVFAAGLGIQTGQRWCGDLVDLRCQARRTAGQIGPRVWLRVLCGSGRCCEAGSLVNSSV
jgi:hypothetical protein